MHPPLQKRRPFRFNGESVGGKRVTRAAADAAEIPLVPRELADAFQRRRFSPAMRRALVRALRGESYRHAAQAEGVDRRTLHRNAASLPRFRECHLRAWRDRLGPAMPRAWTHHLRRLPEHRSPHAESRQQVDTLWPPKP